MAAKKCGNKFTIQFNAADPTHQQIIEILNQQGRKKAQFIVNAIQHYIHCAEAPNMPSAYTPDVTTIESIVLRILNEKEKIDSKEENRIITQEDLTSSSDSTFEKQTNHTLSREEITAIGNAMTMFRNK